MADQKRDSDGKWSSEGGGVERFRDKTNTPLGHVAPHKATGYGGFSTSHGHVGSWNTKENAKKGMEKHFKMSPAEKNKQRWTPVSDEAPSPSAMQGEAGRLARAQARDCMTGRYRP